MPLAYKELDDLGTPVRQRQPPAGGLRRCARRHASDREWRHQRADRAVRRAGLDYWSEVKIHRHRNLKEFYAALPDTRFVYCTTKTKLTYFEWRFELHDCLVFGGETKGLPEDLLAANRERCVTIPMPNTKVRSLNLANSVAIVLYEALRQTAPLDANLRNH